MKDRHYKLTPEPLSEEARNMIRDALERAARISDSTHQGHVVEKLLPGNNLEKPESKFEAGIQDILGLLMQAEGVLEKDYSSNRHQVLVFIKNARRKLVDLAKEERK